MRDNPAGTITCMGDWMMAKTILLVEDDPANYKTVSAMLIRAGHTVDVACDGARAVEMIKTATVLYDVVLMDVLMPMMNGLDATREIRRAGFADLPIIAMTADGFDSDRKNCLDAGMNDFIQKPATHKDVLAQIHKWTKVGSA